MKPLDVLLVLAAALIVAGLAHISTAAALIGAGVCLVAGWVLLDDRG